MKLLLALILLIGFTEICKSRQIKSSDPDKDEISDSWRHYHFTGDNPYHKEITIDGNNRKKATINIPKVALGKELHIILTVKDNGVPSLKKLSSFNNIGQSKRMIN